MDNNNQTLESEYLGITEAADYLRVSASTLRRWEKKGFLVPERTPTGIRRYTKKQLDDVIQTPAYEKPLVSPPSTTIPVNPPQKATVGNVPEENLTIAGSIDNEVIIEDGNELEKEYIHVVESHSVDQFPHNELTSPVDQRPSSYTLSTNTQNYAKISDNTKNNENKEQNSAIVDSFAHLDSQTNDLFSHTEIDINDNNRRGLSNFEPLDQDRFNSIFELDESKQLDESDLSDFDIDSSYIDPEQRPSSYSFSANTKEKRKSRNSWVRPMLLFLSLFCAIVIISLVAWFTITSSPANVAPLNPVIN